MTTIFQTLEDRGNPEEIETHGPFPCYWKNTWLGDGHYFWESFIENAHFWGKSRYGESYIICSAQCEYTTETCLDLVGHPEHLLLFRNIVKVMEADKLVVEKTTVARVIEFMKRKLSTFTYEAIRAHGINTVSCYSYPELVNRLKFEHADKKIHYLDLTPPIQICIIKKKGLNLKNYKIIHPEYYIDGDYI